MRRPLLLVGDSLNVVFICKKIPCHVTHQLKSTVSFKPYKQIQKYVIRLLAQMKSAPNNRTTACSYHVVFRRPAPYTEIVSIISIFIVSFTLQIPIMLVVKQQQRNIFRIYATANNNIIATLPHYT